jgi:hypothetical protein
VRNQTALGLFVYGPARGRPRRQQRRRRGDASATTAGAGAAFAVAPRHQSSARRSRAPRHAVGEHGLAAPLRPPRRSRARLPAATARTPRPRSSGASGAASSASAARRMTDAEASASSAAAFLGAATSVGLATASTRKRTMHRPGDRGANVAALVAGTRSGRANAQDQRATRHGRRRRDPHAGRHHVRPPRCRRRRAAIQLRTTAGPAMPSAPWASDRGLVAGHGGSRPPCVVRRLEHIRAPRPNLAGLGTTVGGALGSPSGVADVNSAAGYRRLGGIAPPPRRPGVQRGRVKPGPTPGRGACAPRSCRPAAARAPAGVAERARARRGLTAARGGRGTFPVLSLTF